MLLGIFLLILILSACLLTNFILSMLQRGVTWGKFYFCLSHVNSEAYQCFIYLSWSVPYLTFFRAWGASYGNVCWHVVSGLAVWFVITCYMPQASCQSLFGGSDMVTLFPPSLIDITMSHMCPWVCCIWPEYSVMFCWHWCPYGCCTVAPLFVSAKEKVKLLFLSFIAVLSILVKCMPNWLGFYQYIFNWCAYLCIYWWFWWHACLHSYQWFLVPHFLYGCSGITSSLCTGMGQVCL